MDFKDVRQNFVDKFNTWQACEDKSSKFTKILEKMSTFFNFTPKFGIVKPSSRIDNFFPPIRSYQAKSSTILTAYL